MMVVSGAEDAASASIDARLRAENADLRSAHSVLLRGVETLKAEVHSLKSQLPRVPELSDVAAELVEAHKQRRAPSPASRGERPAG